MCDDPKMIDDSYVSRRAFGALTLAAAAAGAAGTASAALAVVERDVEITTPDGKADAVIHYPEGSGKYPGVLVWTDIYALRPAFRDMAKRLAGEGYVVVTPNVYYRSAKAPVDRAAASQMRGLLTADALERDARAYMAFLDAQPQVDRAKKAGTQGYCMGGPFTFRTAAWFPDRIAAAASFHGGGLASAQPTSPHLLIPTTKADYLVAIAANDDASDPVAKETLRKAFTDARRPATVEVYAGANHGWTVPDSTSYNQPAAEKAWSELLALYKKTLV